MDGARQAFVMLVDLRDCTEIFVSLVPTGLRSGRMARLRIEAFFVILLLFVAFACGQRSATTPRSTGGATAPPAQFIVLQAERYPNLGKFSSPGFPENYPNNTNITWRIEAGNGDDVFLMFDHFDLEGPRKLDWKCTWDYVAVYDGNNNLIGRLFQITPNLIL
ncbi:uncharacterized protein LOC144879859 [Branchiostoma floridae x Branchiostoma japonicum]